MTKSTEIPAPGGALTGWALRTAAVLIAIPATTLALFLVLERESPGVLSALIRAGNWVTSVILNSPLGDGDAARLTLYLSGAAIVFMLLMLASTALVLCAMALARAIAGALRRTG
ncbi:MAG: hypothetical protein JJU18_13005 [Oceanicaulis sp.]|nr:hypothetical protein [Oceanicaulis sp.]